MGKNNFFGYGGGSASGVHDTPKDSYKRAKETVAEVMMLPFMAYPKRHLSKKVMEILGIRTGVSTKDGETIVAHYFPYYDRDNKVIIGYKKRDLTKTKHERGHFSIVGDVRPSNCSFFGSKFLERLPRKKRINVLEGEYDVAAAYEAFFRNTQAKNKGFPPHVVSISHGTSSAVNSFASNGALLKKYDEIVLGFDNDSANKLEREEGIKKGLEAIEDVANFLMSENLFMLEYLGCKDANEMLEKGLGKELHDSLLWSTKRVESTQVVRQGEIDFMEMMKPKPKGVYIDELPLVSQRMRGFRTSELTMVTGLSGSGKSTIVSKLARGFEKAGHKVGMVFLEENYHESYKRMLADYLKVNFNEFNLDPSVAVAEKLLRENPSMKPEDAYNKAWELCKEAHDYFDQADKFCFHKDFGAVLSLETLLSEFRTLVHIHGCKYIILDHISIAVANSGVKDERQTLDILMAELGAFCVKHDVGIIIVSHLNRGASDVLKNAKEDADPFWARVRKEDLRGSSALEGVSFTILALEIEILPNRERGRCRLAILKNRPTGWLGVCDVYRVDEETGEIIEASMEDAAYGEDGFETTGQQTKKRTEIKPNLSVEEWEDISEKFYNPYAQKECVIEEQNEESNTNVEEEPFEENSTVSFESFDVGTVVAVNDPQSYEYTIGIVERQEDGGATLNLSVAYFVDKADGTTQVNWKTYCDLVDQERGSLDDYTMHLTGKEEIIELGKIATQDCEQDLPF